MTAKPVKRKTKKKRKRTRLKPAVLALILLFSLAAATVGALVLSRYLEMREYKLDYAEAILASSNEFNVDSRLVAAIIYAESGYRNAVVSHAGAVGLMQLMPDTARWACEKLGGTAYSEEKLTEPEYNIRLGTWYISFLLERYGGNVINSLAAYNAGPGNVDKWLANGEYSKDGELTMIPFDETRAYVKRVTSAREKYAVLYEKELG